jgi:hypothetical protein
VCWVPYTTLNTWSQKSLSFLENMLQNLL